jgi:hypothetical protein
MNCTPGCQPNPAQVMNPANMPIVCPPCGGGGGGGGLSAVQTMDTFSVSMSGDGTAANRLQASVKVSPTVAGNMLIENPDGLSVAREVPTGGLMGQVLGKLSNSDQDIGWLTVSGGGGGTISIADTGTIDLAGNGDVTTPLTATIKASPDAGNGVELRANGLFVTAGAVGPVGPRGDSVVPNEWGILTDAKVTAIQTAGVDWVFSVQADNGPTQGDQRANQALPAGISGDMQSHLIRYDASDAVWQDLGPFAGVQGPQGLPGPGIPAGGAVGQFIMKSAVADYATTWVDGITSTVDTSNSTTVSIGGDGGPTTPLVASVIIDPAANNHLSATLNGLFTPREVPTGGAANQVLAKASGADGDLAWVDQTTGLTTVATADSQTLDFSGNGQVGAGITAQLIIDGTTNGGVDELLTAGPNGARVSSLQQFVTKNLAASQLVVGDTGRYLDFTAGVVKSLTVPDNTTAAIPIGATMHLFNGSAGALTITPAGGVTVMKAATQTYVLAENKGASITKKGTNVWQLVGGMEAA